MYSGTGLMLFLGSIFLSSWAEGIKTNPHYEGKAVAINDIMRTSGDPRDIYKIFYTSLDNTGMEYFEALSFCFRNDLVPAVITSAAEDQIILDYLTFLANHANQSLVNTRPMWLTYNDIENEGKFRWLSNSYDEPTSYTNWAPGSPRPALEGGDAQDCVSIQQLGIQGYPKKIGWINLPCSTKWRPLCQAFYNGKALTKL